MITIETCVGSVASAIVAELGGANRVELCAALSEGGTTPSYGTVLMTLSRVNIPVFPIIRPRGGDFVYTEDELQTMIHDIEVYDKLGAHGFSFGVLDTDGRLDKVANARLIKACNGKPTTLHRAFDRVMNPLEELEVAIQLGFDRILTSGTRLSAPEGATTIAELVEQAGDRIIIMAGAGIKPENAKEMILHTGIKELHGTFQGEHAEGTTYKNPAFPSHYKETIGEYTYMQTDLKKIKAVRQSLDDL